jgi:hypothetical protein
VSKKKDFLNVNGAVKEGISLYMLVLCFLVDCAVQKKERTAECILLRYDIWRVHFVNCRSQWPRGLRRRFFFFEKDLLLR